MISTSRIVKNVTLNYAGSLTGGLVFVLITPLMIRELGAVAYGMWVLAHSIVFYLQFLDLGLYDSLVKFISEHGARHEDTSVEKVVSASLRWLVPAGVAAFAISVLLALLLVPWVFHIPEESARVFQTVVMLLGLDLMIGFPASVLNGLLEGYHRFDLANYASMALLVVHALATVALLSLGMGLVALALLELASTVLYIVVHLWLVRRYLPTLRLSIGRSGAVPTGFRRYRFWSALNEILADGVAELDRLIVPALLSVSLLTPYSVICALAGAILLVVDPITDVFFPLSSALDGRADRERLRRLLTSGTKLVVAGCFPVAIFLYFFGDAVILKWIGRDAIDLPPHVLQVVVISFLVAVSASVSRTILTGIGRLRPLFFLTLLESGIAVVLVVLVTPRLGLLGLALGFCVANVAVSLLGVIPLSCRSLATGTLALFVEGLWKPLISAAPASIVAFLLERLFAPREWLQLIVSAMLIAAVYGATFVFVALTGRERRRLWRRSRAALANGRGVGREPVFVARVNVRDARSVARLERKLHPRRRREGRRAIRRLAAESDATDTDLSYGLYEGRRLVGYLLAYIAEESAFEASGENATVYVHDLALLPRYRRFLPALLSTASRAMANLWPLAAVEAHVPPPELERWRRHGRLFNRLGFDLAGTRDCGADINGDSSIALRWEPVDKAVPAAPRHAALPRVSCTPHTYDLDGGRFTVRVVDDEAAWKSLEPVWKELYQRTDGVTAFQDSSYQRLWWRFFGTSRQLFILTIEFDGRTIGIAPLQITPVTVFGRTYRELSFIGTPWEVDRAAFLYPEQPQLAMEATLRFLDDNQHAWDICQLWEQMPGLESTTAIEEWTNRRGYLLGRTYTSICPYIRLDGSWSSFLATRSRRLRKNLRRSKRRLEAEGKLAYEEYDSLPDSERELDRYHDIETRSWKPRSGIGLARGRAYFEFYKSVARAFGDENRFHVRFLTLDNEPIAGTFGLEHDRIYYSTMISHDSGYDRFSPGTLLESMELESCFSRDLVEYDFLGGFLTNKLRWTKKVRQTVHLHIYRPDRRLAPFHFLFFKVKPWFKERLARTGLLQPLLDAQRKWARRSRAPSPARSSRAHIIE